MKEIVAIFLFISSFSFGQVNYIKSIEEKREKLHHELFVDENSPLNKEEKEAISQLDFYPIDSLNICTVTFKKKLGKPFDLPTSSGQTKRYRKYGTIHFTWKGKKTKLAVYQDVILVLQTPFKDYLIIPFKDATSAKETYGAGRYLDFKIPTTKNVELDFNLIYNPYCAYSYRFSCPIPPAENHLKIAIEAGEKTPIERQ